MLYDSVHFFDKCEEHPYFKYQKFSGGIRSEHCGESNTTPLHHTVCLMLGNTKFDFFPGVVYLIDLVTLSLLTGDGQMDAGFLPLWLWEVAGHSFLWLRQPWGPCWGLPWPLLKSLTLGGLWKVSCRPRLEFTEDFSLQVLCAHPELILVAIPGLLCDCHKKTL